MLLFFYLGYTIIYTVSRKSAEQNIGRSRISPQSAYAEEHRRDDSVKELSKITQAAVRNGWSASRILS
jgi:hypothetical protein